MKFEKGKIFNANELVNYTEGGVVSKELIHNNAGSVTLFSFDACIQVIDGEMVLNVEGIDNHIKAGESFIIPAGALHSVKAEQRFKMIITMVRG